MEHLPTKIYAVDQIRKLERRAITKFNISGIDMMHRAGQAAFDLLCEKHPNMQKIVVFCGGGNNGGDGFVLAELAHNAGFDVKVVSLKTIDSLKGEALQAARACFDSGTPMFLMKNDLEFTADIVVDALCGIGLKGAPNNKVTRAIAAINNSQAKVLAIDIPSGINADTGYAEGDAVSADGTITFIGLKPGLFMGAGKDSAGTVFCDDLGLPKELMGSIPTKIKRLNLGDVVNRLVPRKKHAHKGLYGHVLIVGGDYGYAGAVRMAAESTLRIGAGLVSVATRPEHAYSMVATRPEIMAHGVSGKIPKKLLEQATVIAIGPGLGTSKWGMKLWTEVIKSNKPLIVDADALNLLAKHPIKRADWVLTPHPGEAAKLLHSTALEIESDRCGSVLAIQRKFGGIAVLKGAGTVIADQEQNLSICPFGNPGMASGGMGDILTGIIAGLMAQGLEPHIAAPTGVSIHAHAADAAVEKFGERALLATDLFDYLMNFEKS